MKTYQIRLAGCHDETRFETDLTDTEAHLLRRIARHAKRRSGNGCQPTLTITTKETNP